MKLRKGSKVEVFSRRGVPSGSWWCAEIVYGNGHTYLVKYDRHPPNVDSAMERVPRKVIRPRPPSSEDRRSWVPGDVIDVFIDGSWMLSEVSGVIGRGFFLVRLVGSSKQFRVHSSDIRQRLSLQGNKWAIVGEDPVKFYNGGISYVPNDATPGCQALPQSMAVEHNAVASLLPSEICNYEDEGPRISLKGTRKRPPVLFPAVDVCEGASRKMRTVEKLRRIKRPVAGHSPKFLEKADAVVSQQIFLGEKYKHSSFENRAVGNSEMDMGRVNQITAEGCNILWHQNSDNARSTSSSVGSCDISSPCATAYPIICLAHDRNSHQDEVDSYCDTERVESHSTEEIFAEEIHRLELLAYRSTMEALVCKHGRWEMKRIQSLGEEMPLSLCRKSAITKAELLFCLTERLPLYCCKLTSRAGEIPWFLYPRVMDEMRLPCVAG